MCLLSTTDRYIYLFCTHSMPIKPSGVSVSNTVMHQCGRDKHNVDSQIGRGCVKEQLEGVGWFADADHAIDG